MPEPVHIDGAAATDVGVRRKSNQDVVLCLAEAGVFCVADGMGGASGGAAASRKTVETIEASVVAQSGHPSLDEQSRRIRDAVSEAGHWIKQNANERGVSGSGTTVVVLFFDANQPDRALTLHAGDSRAYRFRDGQLVQITRDHSVAEHIGADGEHALPRMFRGVVMRAVGLEEEVELEETEVAVQDGDLFLLCSDGLSKMVNDSAMAALLASHASASLDATAKALIAAANEAGGEDNVSAVLVRAGTPPGGAAPTPPSRPQRLRIFGWLALALLAAFGLLRLVQPRQPAEIQTPPREVVQTMDIGRHLAELAAAWPKRWQSDVTPWESVWQQAWNTEAGPLREELERQREAVAAICRRAAVAPPPALPTLEPQTQIQCADHYCNTILLLQDHLLVNVESIYRKLARDTWLFGPEVEPMVQSLVSTPTPQGSPLDADTVRTALNEARAAIQRVKKWMDTVNGGPWPISLVELCPADAIAHLRHEDLTHLLEQLRGQRSSTDSAAP